MQGHTVPGTCEVAGEDTFSPCARNLRFEMHHTLLFALTNNYAAKLRKRGHTTKQMSIFVLIVLGGLWNRYQSPVPFVPCSME